MDNTKSNFKTRKNEIDSYFKFLTIFDDDETKIQYKKGGATVVEKVQPQFHTILIANAFLILYNLIESTVRNSIIEIYEIIETEKLTYEKLSKKIKQIWIKQTTDNLKEGTYNQSTLQKYIQELANEIITKETVRLSKDKLDFSGNLDAQKIRELAKKIGFKKSNDGRNLEEIKKKRNRLAHGEQTFYEVGKDFSVRELRAFKDETIEYLSDVINNVETFISEKKYLELTLS